MENKQVPILSSLGRGAGVRLFLGFSPTVHRWAAALSTSLSMSLIKPTSLQSFSSKAKLVMIDYVGVVLKRIRPFRFRELPT